MSSVPTRGGPDAALPTRPPARPPESRGLRSKSSGNLRGLPQPATQRLCSPAQEAIRNGVLYLNVVLKTR